MLDANDLEVEACVDKQSKHAPWVSIMMALAFAISDPEALATKEGILKEVLTKYTVYEIEQRQKNYCVKHMQYYIDKVNTELSETSQKILEYWRKRPEVNNLSITGLIFLTTACLLYTRYSKKT